MADITVTTENGDQLAAMSGDIQRPYRGNWTMELQLSTSPDNTPSGLVSVDFHGASYKGIVYRAGQDQGTWSMLIGGGKGGLYKVPPPKNYDNGMSIRLPVTELLAAVGETLSPTSTASVLSQAIAAWPRTAQEAGALLDELAGFVGAVWRVLPDGSIFFGIDEWKVAADTGVDATLLSTDPVRAEQTFLPLTPPSYGPGVTIAGRRVGRIVFQETGDEFTAWVFYMDEGGESTQDLVVAGLIQIIREETAYTKNHPGYLGQVIQQRQNGTLDILLDDRRWPSITNVPYLVPVPGAALTVAAGSRVEVTFLGGDGRRPVAGLYERGSATKEIVLTGDQVDCGTLTLTVTGGAMAPAVLAGTYRDPFGQTTTVASGTPIPLKGKPKGSAALKLP